MADYTDYLSSDEPSFGGNFDYSNIGGSGGYTINNLPSAVSSFGNDSYKNYDSYIPYATPEELQNYGGFGLGTVEKPNNGIINTLGKAGQKLIDTLGSKSAAELIKMIASGYTALKSQNPNYYKQSNPYAYTQAPNLGVTYSREQIPQKYEAYTGKPVMGSAMFTKGEYKKAAHGGIMELARGGQYLEGDTDGMADKIDTSIDGEQPAKLSHGEFVIPADVVSHLGNGNSKAGADVLYKMMERVRKARTGNPKQGKQINPEKFTPGGVAEYAGGGAVAFAVGGPAAGVTDTSLPNTFSGPYIQQMLEKYNALSNTPYQAYTGPLTAGTSPLQNQAFSSIQNLPTTYNPTRFNTGLGQVGSVESYISPYVQNVIDFQSNEARRQADISRTADQAKAVQSGAFGGSRQGIMDAENRRNLGTTLSGIAATGYQNAYDRAQAQRLAEAQASMEAQRLGEVSKQYGAGYGISANNAMLNAGNAQRGIEQEGINANLAEFNKQQLDPFKKAEFMQSGLTGVPTTSSMASYNTSPANQNMDLFGGIAGLFGS
jgi:hypothetical protein